MPCIAMSQRAMVYIACVQWLLLRYIAQFKGENTCRASHENNTLVYFESLLKDVLYNREVFSDIVFL